MIYLIDIQGDLYATWIDTSNEDSLIQKTTANIKYSSLTIFTAKTIPSSRLKLVTKFFNTPGKWPYFSGFHAFCNPPAFQNYLRFHCSLHDLIHTKVSPHDNRFENLCGVLCRVFSNTCQKRQQPVMHTELTEDLLPFRYNFGEETRCFPYLPKKYHPWA